MWQVRSNCELLQNIRNACAKLRDFTEVEFTQGKTNVHYVSNKQLVALDIYEIIQDSLNMNMEYIQ